MALRLQSNLLYGVARVYSQQCGYILSDAELAKQQMMTLTKVMRSSGLEAEGATKGRYAPPSGLGSTLADLLAAPISWSCRMIQSSSPTSVFCLWTSIN